MSRKLLVAFDFDDTLIDGNSDIVVQELSPTPIPTEIKSLNSSSGWTEFMGAVFQHLHKQGVTSQQILTCMENIKFVDGMEHLLKSLSKPDASADVIIISDSNSVFIDHILRSSCLHDTVAQVYTNPAQFDDNNLLLIKGYHVQDWCKLSTVNMCKGHILSSHIQEQSALGVTYERIAYVGDGTNDFCPSLRLSANDLVFPREGFRLMKKINETGTLIAKCIPWKTGHTIANELKVASDTNS